MSKKDYVMLASHIRAIPDDMDDYERNLWVDALCNDLETDNPQFDRARFKAACGLEVTDGKQE